MKNLDKKNKIYIAGTALERIGFAMVVQIISVFIYTLVAITGESENLMRIGVIIGIIVLICGFVILLAFFEAGSNLKASGETTDIVPIVIDENKSIQIDENEPESEPQKRYTYKTDKGVVEILIKNSYSSPKVGDLAFLDEKPAPDGKYKFGFMWYVHVSNGKVSGITLF